MDLAPTRSRASCLTLKSKPDRLRSAVFTGCVRCSHAYDGDESSARMAQAGLWAGAFVAPWDWRDGVCKAVLGAVSVPTDGKAKLCGLRDMPPNPGCTIKANMKPSHGDQCIYHKEGSHGYAKLRMDKHGRRWFCTEAEAQGAGCREAESRQ